ncbi:MAG TPA: hypothetical protein DCR14_05040 [Acidimicrobiaceae bacterium]|nr:hypothetical protein [Acidimicrobiaceae bacterium]
MVVLVLVVLVLVVLVVDDEVVVAIVVGGEVDAVGGGVVAAPSSESLQAPAATPNSTAIAHADITLVGVMRASLAATDSIGTAPRCATEQITE